MFCIQRWQKLFGTILKMKKNNVCLTRKKLVEKRKIFQFVYSKTYPEAYSFVEERGIDIRNEFHLKFKEWKDKSTKG